MAALPMRWVPVVIAAFVALVAAASYALFDDPETHALTEAFAAEEEERARKEREPRAPRELTDQEFEAHAVRAGLYSKIYRAFVSALGEPAAGESVAEVAEAYRSGRATLDGLRDYIRGKDPSHWKREAREGGGGAAGGGSQAGSSDGGAATVAGHARDLVASLGESLPADALRAVESAVSQGHVALRDLWDGVQSFREAFGAGGRAGGRAGAREAFDAGGLPPPRETPPQAGNVPNAADPEGFRRPDGTFDTAAFDRAFRAEAAKTGALEDGAPRPTVTPPPPGAAPPPRSPGAHLLEHAVRRVTGSDPEEFRKADGTFDTDAFNARFMAGLAEGRAASPGSAGIGVAIEGARERDDGGPGRTGSSSSGDVLPGDPAALAIMAAVGDAERRAEAREPYRVFPFPHAPPFLPARFADDTQGLEQRVSAVYRTVFGRRPDSDARRFLAGRLRAWGGDMRRLSNLVSTMHTIASAEALRKKLSADQAAGAALEALSKGAGEAEARELARQKAAAGDAEASRGAAELAAASDELTPAAVSEVAGVTARLLASLERDGVPPAAAAAGVETAIRDWREAQLAAAALAPRSTTEVYLDSRSLGALATSRQFEDPAVAL